MDVLFVFFTVCLFPADQHIWKIMQHNCPGVYFYLAANAKFLHSAASAQLLSALRKTEKDRKWQEVKLMLKGLAWVLH